MKAEGRELEPLCYRVRPMVGEGFDSWLDRLAGRHEVSRRELFRHLAADPHLAAFDLARGTMDVPVRHHGAFRQLVAKLAWAVGTDIGVIEACFVDWPVPWLLPLSLRHFGCARCWQADGTAGRPIAVKREWLLRLSWWCHEHGMPLSPWPDRGALRASRQMNWLAQAERQARALAEYARPSGRLIAVNHEALHFLQEDDDGLFPKGQRRYFEAMIDNAYHLTSVRIPLLALRHGRRSESARRFEQFAQMTRRELFGPSTRIFKQRTALVEGIDTASPRTVPKLVTNRRWRAEFADLLEGYAQCVMRGCARVVSSDAVSPPNPLRSGAGVWI